VLCDDGFTFEGLEPIEQRFLRRAAGATYLVIKDRSERNHEETLDRLELTEDDLAPYLDRPFGLAPMAQAEDEWDENPDEDDEDLDDEEDENDEPPRAAASASDPLTNAEKMRAAFRWVRECAVRNTIGDSSTRFRVKLYGPKGVNCLATGQFVCRNDAYDLDDAVMPKLEIPAPTFEEAARAGSVKGLKALGDYYAQWGQIVLGSVGQLQGVNNAMLAKLHKQLEESRGQVDQLVASILEFRVKEIEVQENRLADERDGDARTTLAREALGQLGAAANTFLASRGMTPDMLEVFTQLGGSPELMAALKDPSVRALMQDHDNLKGLAEMLRQAGSQAQAAQAAPNPNPTESAA
jgi:hypothetical protein